MVQIVAQVLEDERTNLIHLISQVDQRKCSSPTAFVQTGSGVQTCESGKQYLQGQLRHRYTGTYNGDVSSYINAVNNSSRRTFDNKKMLKKSGILNLRSGLGAAISVGFFSYQAYNLAGLWDQCTADGIVSTTEWFALGVDALGMVSGSTAVRIGSAVGSNVMENTGFIENGGDVSQGFESETGVNAFDEVVNTGIEEGGNSILDFFSSLL